MTAKYFPLHTGCVESWIQTLMTVMIVGLNEGQPFCHETIVTLTSPKKPILLLKSSTYGPCHRHHPCSVIFVPDVCVCVACMCVRACVSMLVCMHACVPVCVCVAVGKIVRHVFVACM